VEGYLPQKNLINENEKSDIIKNNRREK